MSTTDARVMGTLRAENGTGIVRMKDVFATGIDDLWAAITEPARLRRWIADVEGDLVVGGEFAATFTSTWDGRGRIDICDAPTHLLVTTWDASDTSETQMEAWLRADGPNTVLVVEERGLPLEDYADHGAGWQTHVEDLRAMLEGRPASIWRDRWQALTPAYRELATAVATSAPVAGAPAHGLS